MNGIHDKERLRELQTLPLERKIQITQTRIIDWYQHYNGGVYVSFSGGKDSTVLLHIARQLYPTIPAVFSNTGLEYPEIQRFVKKFENVEVITPKYSFRDVISKYGYPLISKEVANAIYQARHIRPANDSKHGDIRKRRELLGTHMGPSGYTSRYDKKLYLPIAQELPAIVSHLCCQRMKKDPFHAYQKRTGNKPILATLASESLVREKVWLQNGCNAFEGENPMSQPMAFWKEQDILSYIVKYGVELASVYGEIVSVGDDGNPYPPVDVMGNILCGLKCTQCQRTGCIFCAFGAHLEKGETRFQRLARTHPKQYEYCIGGGGWTDNPFYDPTAPKMDGEWKNWNPKKVWSRDDKGLGMGKVFDMVNELYGKKLIRYD